MLSLALVEARTKDESYGVRKMRGRLGRSDDDDMRMIAVLRMLASGLLATYACIFFHYFNRLW